MLYIMLYYIILVYTILYYVVSHYVILYYIYRFLYMYLLRPSVRILFSEMSRIDCRECSYIRMCTMELIEIKKILMYNLEHPKHQFTFSNNNFPAIDFQYLNIRKKLFMIDMLGPHSLTEFQFWGWSNDDLATTSRMTHIRLWGDSRSPRRDKYDFEPDGPSTVSKRANTSFSTKSQWVKLSGPQHIKDDKI